jgi:hypothetical protein
MKRNDVFGVLGVAGATLAFTLSVLGPWNTAASDDAKPIKPRILSPTLASHGCQFTLKTAKATYAAGESPTVELTAFNPTGQTADATVWVTLSATDVPSPLARTLAMLRPVWSKSWCVSLKPGETKTTSLTADAKLGAKQEVTITLRDKQQAVLIGKVPLGRNIAPTAAAEKK